MNSFPFEMTFSSLVGPKRINIVEKKWLASQPLFYHPISSLSSLRLASGKNEEPATCLGRFRFQEEENNVQVALRMVNC
jgi:hypothetical protein